MDPRSTVSPGPSRTARRGHRLLAAALAVTLVAGTSACAGDDAADPADGGPGSSAAEGTDALEPEVTVDPGPAPVVDLIDAGEGERRVLAYAPSLEPSVVAITRSANSRTEVPGAEPRTDDTPAQTLTVEGRSEPDVDGAQRATVTAREFTSVDELRNAQFSTAPGFTVTWTRSADGIVRELSLAAPSGATDAARAGVEITANAVSDATVAFPTEEIGVGARWTVTRRVDDAVAPTRVTTYELVDVDGDIATVRSSTTAPDPAGTLAAPAPDGGPGVTLDVESYEVTGSGELMVDLRAPVPVGGTTESSTRAVYVDPDSGRRTTYDEDSVLRFRSVD
ncbi:hypothetical protein ACIQCV_08620 [Dietzia maris]|uniref:hypothetical protein n=1 Tax=Dietzia TaxID=37914 RepID=UPI001D051EEC|nr:MULTISPECIES: hypothetical protein [Dietzia]MCZ4539727.1 hypothetical protein [Dietzia maris]MCZ4656820.1 hypothetical protein [Dietzia kunjamensis]MDJ0423339.1 hypothetical protein [Dietzia kunjamensis]MDV3355805.1 hypothetical protein [Dietzia sp. IN118]